ncbi:hypothetical protein JTB14_004826 [Gonioctena quinquepunctata]|nr:hypothetical protein JTB14_004826 [Gonioctena quinquepunctata]
MPGSKKEWEKWRKTWHDLKTAVKAKGAVIEKHQSATGGGPPNQSELSNEVERILELIAPVAYKGHHILESQEVFLENADSSQEHNHETKEDLKGNSEQGASKNSEIKLDEAAKKNSAIKSRDTRVQRLNNPLAV